MQPTQDVTLAPELMMSNLEILSKLKYKDLILCDEKNSKITVDTRKFFTSLRPQGFNITILENTMLSSLSFVTKSPLSNEAVRIFNLWPYVMDSVENLRDTLFKNQYENEGLSLRKLIEKIKIISLNILDEKCLTALIAKDKKGNYDSPIPQPPPPPLMLKKAQKANNVGTSSATSSFQRIAITEDLLKGVTLRKIEMNEKKCKTSEPIVEAFRFLLQRSSAFVESQQKEKTLNFDQYGYWESDD